MKRHSRRVKSVALTAAVSLVALAVGCSNSPTTDPSGDFRWAVLSDNQLLLVEEGPLLYPASRQGSAIYESLPEQIDVRRYHNDETGRVSIARVHSPRNLDRKIYLAEIRQGSSWEAAADFRLNGFGFEIRAADGSWQSIGPGAIRFRAR
jgi:hypothetical protein